MHTNALVISMEFTEFIKFIKVVCKMLAYNLSNRRIIKSFQQLHCSALSTARRANQCDCLTLFNTEVKVIKHGNSTACWIREMNVREPNQPTARLLLHIHNLLHNGYTPCAETWTH